MPNRPMPLTRTLPLTTDCQSSKPAGIAHWSPSPPWKLLPETVTVDGGLWLQPSGNTGAASGVAAANVVAVPVPVGVVVAPDGLDCARSSVGLAT